MSEKVDASVGLNATSRPYLPADHGMVSKMDRLPESSAAVADVALTTRFGIRVYVLHHGQWLALISKTKPLCTRVMGSEHRGNG